MSTPEDPSMALSRSSPPRAWPSTVRSVGWLLVVGLLVAVTIEGLAASMVGPAAGDLLRIGRNVAYVILVPLLAAYVLATGRVRSFVRPVDVALAVLTVVLFVGSLVAASSLRLTVEGVFVYLRAVIVFYAIRALRPDWPSAVRLGWVLGAILVLNAVVATVQAFAGLPAFTVFGFSDLTWAAIGRSQGLQVHPNHLGHIVGLGSLALLGWMASVPHVARRWWALFILLAFAIAASQSRESVLGLVAGFAVVFALRRRATRRVAGAFAVLVTLVVMVWVAHPANFAELARRLVGVITAIEIPSGHEAGVECDPAKEACTIKGLPHREVRVLYMQQGVALWARQPVFGYGVGQFGGNVAFEDDPRWYLDPRFGPEGFDMHGFEAKQVDSFWLHLVVETGTVGSVAYGLWYLLLGLPLARAMWPRRRAFPQDGPADPRVALQPAAVAALAFGAVVAVFSPSLEDPMFPALLFALLGFAWLAGEAPPAHGSSAPDSPPVGDPAEPIRPGPLRILFVTNMWPERGDFRGTFVEQQAQALQRLGHQVDVEIVAQSRGVADYVLAAPRVRRRARRGAYDVVHVHFGMTAMAARFTGLPRVISLYGSDINDRPKRWWTRLGWGGAAARVYVSRRLATTAGDPRGLVIPNGVDFELFQPADRAAARARLGLAPVDRVILFGSHPGRTGKGHELFTAVVARLRSRGIQARELILSAPGQPLGEVVAKYEAADILLFTSNRGSEGSPTAVKEAIVMGLPVVTVDVGDVVEMLADVEPSTVVPFPRGWADPAARIALADRLAEAAAQVLATGRRADGRDRREWLALDRVTARVVEVYTSVAR